MRGNLGFAAALLIGCGGSGGSTYGGSVDALIATMDDLTDRVEQLEAENAALRGDVTVPVLPGDLQPTILEVFDCAEQAPGTRHEWPAAPEPPALPGWCVWVQRESGLWEYPDPYRVPESAACSPNGGDATRFYRVAY